ncbi:MAG: hypothetical protein ACXVPU_09430 [Bacteroidia bacterium]
MKLNRNKIFAIGVIIVLLFITVNRLDFIIGSKFTSGKVIKIHKWEGRRSQWFAPVIQFSDDKYIYTFEGETNSDLGVGEEVSVVYKLADPLNARVFSFVGFILSPMIYSLIPFALLAAAVYSFIEPYETVTINMQGISRNKSTGPVQFKNTHINKSIDTKK